MKNIIIGLAVLAALSLTIHPAFSQDLYTKGRSALELQLGVWSGGASNTVGVTGIRSEAKVGAFAGGLLYTNWIRENISVTLSAGLLAAKASSTVSHGGIDQQVSSVVPLLLGIRFYLPEPLPDAMVRPFLSAAVGTYVGSEAKNTLLTQEAHTEAAFGGRLGAGIDFFLSDHFKLGANAGYHLLSDFSTPVGARKNYSGADFSIGIGYVF